MKIALTTGEVAKICNVSQKTVIKWFDDGIIKGYKIPGTKDRRIPIKNLTDFLKSNNIPISAISSNYIDFYWDHFHGNKKECKDCIVFKNRILNCYNYGMEYIKGWFFCKHDCENCDYFKKYSDKEKNDINEFCWDFLGNNSKCKKCLVYNSTTLKCFELRKRISVFCKNCDEKCSDCEYFKFLKTAELTVV